MPERYIIEGSSIRHERIDLISEAPLDSISDYLVTVHPFTLPLLPYGTMFQHINPDEGVGLLVVEREPRLHTIAVAAGTNRVDMRNADDDGYARYRVLIPWSYFAFLFEFRFTGPAEYSNFRINDTRQYWTPRRITSVEDILTPAACPNVDASGGICWGSTNSEMDEDTLAGKINYMVNLFYTTNFNSDLGHRGPFGTNYQTWATNSEDPVQYPNWALWGPDTPYRTTLRDLPSAMGAGRPDWIETVPTHVSLPEVPADFSIARAQQWLADLPDTQRQRLIAATAAIEAAS